MLEIGLRIIRDKGSRDIRGDGGVRITRGTCLSIVRGIRLRGIVSLILRAGIPCRLVLDDLLIVSFSLRAGLPCRLVFDDLLIVCLRGFFVPAAVSPTAHHEADDECADQESPQGAPYINAGHEQAAGRASKAEGEKPALHRSGVCRAIPRRRRSELLAGKAS